MKIPWHHRPAHRFVPGTLYMVTAGTLNKEPFYKGDERLELLQDTLLDTIEKHAWEVQAWAVFVNHYHFIAMAPEEKADITSLIKEIHSVAAKRLNGLDGIRGRRVWFQYWDTCLTYEKSRLVRLNYVNNNAVHHKLVRNAIDYPYCSALWFEQQAQPEFVRKVRSFRYDRLKITDDF